MTIKDKVVIITGASSGIGQATAELLAKRGAKLVLAARREERLLALTEKINQAGGDSVFFVMDVVKADENQALVAFAKKTYGSVDAIFLNAGIMPSSPLSALKVDEWKAMIDVNLNGVLNGIAAVLPEFIEQKSGHILATSSVAGLKAYPNAGVYGATKWAIRELMEVLRIESAMEESNIRTSTIYPAAIKSELLKGITDKDAAESMNKLYAEYQISSDSIAEIVAFALDQPEGVNVSEFTVGPTRQAW
ncbi:SDR family oxidoreductase [Lactococcus sp.]|uniref:SDR family oxidoreductase n=1 Tax=Lactococcus sp. TaxID=44273 RepID=UPI0035B3D98A